MVLTVSAGLYALPRLWWLRQDGLMLTCRTPPFLQKKGLFFYPSKYLICLDVSDRRGEKADVTTRVVWKRMPKHLWPSAWVLSNPAIIQVSWVIMFTHSYEVGNLFREMLHSEFFRNRKSIPFSSSLPTSGTDSILGLCHWSVSVIWG